MVAVKYKIEVNETEVEVCSECQDTGIIKYLSEYSFFEDRRSCRKCQAGRLVGARLDEIIARAQAEDRLYRRQR